MNNRPYRVFDNRCLRFVVLVFVLLFTMRAGAQDLADHRNAQFATFGTDFWLSIPRTWGGMNQNNRMICIVAEHDCDVTFSNPLLGYSETHHVLSHYTISNRLDTTNFFVMPESIVNYADTLNNHLSDSSLQIPFHPMPHSIHVTSTDTIAVFTLIYALGSTDAINILPTEMLRDEYVVEGYPTNNSIQGYDIVATEDSTVVDIVLAGHDWLGRKPGDTVTVTLNRGQLYHFRTGTPNQKYGYNIPYIDIRLLGVKLTVHNHSFRNTQVIGTDTFCVDLTGTHIMARDCKRIAVIEWNALTTVPSLTGRSDAYNTPNGDNVMDQALPIRYAGKEYLVPNLQGSDTDFLRIVGLVDGTRVTIVDESRISDRVRSFTVNASKCYWFQMAPGEGPFRITSTEPVIVKLYSMGNNYSDVGDPGKVTLIPTEWWHSGPIHNHTVHYTDPEGNMYHGWIFSHYFARTQDVPNLMFDNLWSDTIFRPLSGMPYSYAYFDRYSRFSTVGTHDVVDTTLGFFYGICQTPGNCSHAIWNMPHLQPGGTFLTVNDIYADSLPADTIRCLYDPVRLHSWSERPADSIFWDFGDGTTSAFAYDDGQYVEHLYADTGRYTIQRIITWLDEGEEGCLGCRSCFNRPNDTAYAQVWLHNHYDSLITVRLCEGSYFFRGNEYSYTDTFYYTSYWTPSGCDTLFTIDLVTCPHCSYVSDTVAPDDLPHYFHGVAFGSPQYEFPVDLPLDDDDCDSIIFYTLVVLNNWGEEPIDSVIIMAPNIITPNLETNNRFRVVASRHIEQMEVTVYNRFGVRVAQFDGLTQEWDATYKGIPVKQDAYVYYVRYVDSYDKGWKTLKGTVTVVR